MFSDSGKFGISPCMKRMPTGNVPRNKVSQTNKQVLSYHHTVVIQDTRMVFKSRIFGQYTKDPRRQHTVLLMYDCSVLLHQGKHREMQILRYSSRELRPQAGEVTRISFVNSEAADNLRDHTYENDVLTVLWRWSS